MISIGLRLWQEMPVPGTEYTSFVAQSVVGATTTAETVLATIPIAANAMGANGYIEIFVFATANNSANNKTVRIRHGASGSGTGGNLYTASIQTTLIAVKFHQIIANRNSVSSQIGNLIIGDDGYGAGSNSHVTHSLNTAQASEIVITGQCASSSVGEQVTLEGYVVRVTYKP